MSTGSPAEHLFRYNMDQAPNVKIGDIPIIFRPLKHPEHGVSGYDGPEHSVTVLKAGHRKTEGVKSFDVDTIWEKDIEIPMRDGVILKGDIFRPAHGDAVPAIIPWSPYGKTGRGRNFPIHITSRSMLTESLKRPIPQCYAGQNGCSNRVHIRIREVRGS
jgi:predicted acyl esterase